MAQFFFATRQIADDEAASSIPERFTFRRTVNVAQAFGHDAAAGGRNINANPGAQIFKGTVDDSPSPYQGVKVTRYCVACK
ncbi:MAG: hypothetical protein ACLP2Y_03860 [Limisphaerales bacterium]